MAVAVVIATGALHFDAHRAFDFPPGRVRLVLGFLFGLGAASRIGIYDYLGYYNVCYIGDEVKDPGRVIPRSILISTIAVAVIYIAINLSIIGVVPWRDFVPSEDKPAANFIVSIFMEQIYGPTFAAWFTLLILWTAFASVFALLLGYSRIPYAAARDGYFFKPFARLHPKGQFPSVSLVVLGVLSIACSAFSLGSVIVGAPRDPDPGAVHRPDRRGGPAAAEATRHATSVSHLALSAAAPPRAGRLDLCVRDDRPGDSPVRAGSDGPGRRRVRAVVLAGEDLAVRAGGLGTQRRKRRQYGAPNPCDFAHPGCNRGSFLPSARPVSRALR